MSGNRQAYEQAMNAGHNAAWDQDWQIAIAAYGKAIQEFPQDPEAHIHLGLGLLELGRLEDALKVYTRAHQLSPRDPIPLENSADVLERMGRLREAAQQYVNVSEIYLMFPDLEKAIANWERATRLTPGLIAVHAKLAQAYERIGNNTKAIREYLTLAYNFQRLGDSEKAMKAAQRGLRLERNNSQLMNTIRALESGKQLMPPVDDAATQSTRRNSNFDRDARRSSSSTGEVAAVSDPRGPLGESINDSLGLLAAYVMDGNANEVTGDALQAMEAQRQGLVEEAVSAYERAESRLKHPALFMNLGALLLQSNRPEDAGRYLNQATKDEHLAVGAHQALGQALHKMGRYRDSIRESIKALEMIDSDQSFSFDYGTTKDSIFTQVQAGILQDSTDEQATAISERLSSLMQGKDWKQRLDDFKRQLSETLREQGMKGVIDILVAKGGDRLASMVASIDRHIRQGLWMLAMDEAHSAIEFSPNYLPLHIRMAEIMMREGRPRSAITKYNVIARTYLARGENERASAILYDVLELAPLDVSVRESLIELLEAEERWDEALDQYIDLADTHHQLGDFDASRDTYSLAERVAQRVGADVDKLVRIKHRIADIDQMRLDTRRSQKIYEEIITLAPKDERAHRMLVELNYRQGNQVEAIRRLDKLLGIFAASKQIQRIIQLLEELVRLYPSDTGLRSRLASIYRQLGRNTEAIAQLDALGELQLEAGLHKDAANTIRLILSLNPTDHLDEYRKLLVQLGG